MYGFLFQDSLKTDVSGNGLKHLTPISNSPDGEAEYDLRVVSMEILKYLSSLTMLYTAPPQDTQEKDTVEVSRVVVIYQRYILLVLNNCRLVKTSKNLIR